jgi:hypothetical protein
MASLLDVAPISEKVKLPGGQEVDVTGVSAHGIAILFQRFPELRMLVTGQQVDRTQLIALAPQCLAAIIAAATGTPGNEKAEAVGTSLPLETQLDIIEAAIRITMPKGVGPFADRLVAFLNSVGVLEPQGSTTKVPATTSAQASSS